MSLLLQEYTASQPSVCKTHVATVVSAREIAYRVSWPLLDCCSRYTGAVAPGVYRYIYVRCDARAD